MSGLESFILENVHEDIRDDYDELFSCEDDDTFNLAVERINKYIAENSGTEKSSVDAVLHSVDYQEMKANQTVKGNLLGDSL